MWLTTGARHAYGEVMEPMRMCASMRSVRPRGHTILNIASELRQWVCADEMCCEWNRNSTHQPHLTPQLLGFSIRHDVTSRHKTCRGACLSAS